jgi:hypothetical protein
MSAADGRLLRMATGTYGGWLIAMTARCGTLYAEATIETHGCGFTHPGLHPK